jgi:serine protease Do
MSAEIRALTQRAARAVVEIQVVSYGTGEENGGGTLTRQQGLGSGVIIDPGGLIVTNAHVVANAIDVKVLLNPPRGPARDDENVRAVDARILGVDRESDLALLKVDVKGLPVLSLAPFGSLRQGDLVLAIGNPFGLRNSVSLGVVSATARSLNESSPVTYIQTDASINPGNSGGALVDAVGRLVGINTFILSRSGGNEGLGFAIPANIVQEVVSQLRRTGHVERGEVGALLEDITPALAAGLSLPRAKGLIVADVQPGSPASQAGLRIGDILLAVNGHRVESVGRFRGYVYFKRPGETLAIDFQRGEELKKTSVTTRARPMRFDPLAALGSPEKHLIPRLGILGLELNSDLVKNLPPLREAAGVLVAARAEEGLGQLIDLQPGDVIHALNGTSVLSLTYLQAKVAEAAPGASLALQIEREGRMQFVAFVIE